MWNAPVLPGETTRSTLILNSKLLDRADRKAGELAAYADRARAAGVACEAAYDGEAGFII